VIAEGCIAGLEHRRQARECSIAVRADPLPGRFPAERVVHQLRRDPVSGKHLEVRIEGEIEPLTHQRGRIGVTECAARVLAYLRVLAAERERLQLLEDRCAAHL
jgi:hypothetical protein